MLQIKKHAFIINIKYNLIYLFRRKTFDKLYKVRKQKTTRVFVRAPKHFNIGKQKILHLNYKMPALHFCCKSPVNLTSFITKHDTLYRAGLRGSRTNPALNMGSLKFRIRTLFNIMWLAT